MRILVALLGCLGLLQLCGGQETAQQHPKSWPFYRSAHPEVLDPPTLPFARVDADDFLIRSGGKLGQHLNNIHAVAPKGFQDFDAIDAGEWMALPEGGWIWRLVLQSPQAPHQVAVFSDIRIPLHGELFIYTPGLTRGFEVCDDYCYRYGALDVPHMHTLTTPSMPGDEIWLEYYQPHSPDLSGDEGLPTLHIAAVMQGLPEEGSDGENPTSRRLMQDDPPVDPAAVAPVDAALKVRVHTQFDRQLPQLQQKTDKTGRCTHSILCDPNWATERQAVVSIYAINLDKSDPEDYGTIGLCTGTFLNAPSGAWFLLTADHCFADKKSIDNFQYWMLIFNYETGCGKKSAPPFRQLIQGVRLVFYDSESDVLLLQLPSSIPSDFKPYLMGWDARPEAVPLSAVAIHHPAGSVKRISYTNGTGAIVTSFPTPSFPTNEIQPSQATHFQILWSGGSTEGGSSGSPLIDTTTRRVVGVLSGGFASCANPTGNDYYGRLSAAWDKGLVNFLQEVNLNTGGSFSLGKGENIQPVALSPEGQHIAETLLAKLGDKNLTDATQPYSSSRPFISPGPGIGFYPSTLVITEDGDPGANITAFLSESPAPGETIIAKITLSASGGSEQGKSSDPTSLVTYSPSVIYFTSQNYSGETVISVTRIPSARVVKLARFDIIFTLSSNKNATFNSLFGAKGIVDTVQRNLSDFTPIVIPKLPWKPSVVTILALVRQIQASSKGKGALFEFTPSRDVNVTLNLCWDALAQATATVYKDKAIAWSLASQPPPAGSTSRCINLPNLRFVANSTYNIVVSDDSFFNGVLPLDVLKNLALTHAKDLGISEQQIRAALGPAGAPDAAPILGDASTPVLGGT